MRLTVAAAGVAVEVPAPDGIDDGTHFSAPARGKRPAELKAAIQPFDGGLANSAVVDTTTSPLSKPVISSGVPLAMTTLDLATLHADPFNRSAEWNRNVSSGKRKFAEACPCGRDRVSNRLQIGLDLVSRVLMARQFRAETGPVGVIQNTLREI